MNKTAAVIVSYNPDVLRFKQGIEAIASQVQTLYCFDNGSENVNEIRDLCKKFNNIVLIENKENKGISFALNQVISSARDHGVDWLLTLDQDSVCPDNMIKTMLVCAEKAEKKGIAAICPYVVDRRRPEETVPSSPEEYVDFCITSGCFVNTRISETIGDFDPWLFIGLIDDEFCHRIGINGYKILRINTIRLDHEMGELTPSKHKKLFLFLGSIFHSPIFLALTYKRKVSPMRVYYATRNIIYLSKKFEDYPNSKFTRKRAVYNAVSNILRGREKYAIAEAAISGYRDGGDAVVQKYRTVR